MSEIFWRLRKKVLKRIRERQKLYTYDQVVSKVRHRNGIYFVGSWTLLGCALGYYLFVHKDPVTGGDVYVRPSQARMYSMGINREFVVTTFDEEKKEWVEKVVNPSAIDDD